MPTRPCLPHSNLLVTVAVNKSAHCRIAGAVRRCTLSSSDHRRIAVDHCVNSAGESLSPCNVSSACLQHPGPSDRRCCLRRVFSLRLICVAVGLRAISGLQHCRKSCVTISGGCNSNPLTVQNTPSDVVSVMHGPACWRHVNGIFDADF